jgi:low affinity Fe/Cu permease
MANRKPASFGARFEAFSTGVTRWTGSTQAFALALVVIVVWAILGPLFHYSDTWQLVINTSTTIITFLMVFLIQRSQNKDSLALHLKLNELVAAMQGASNRLIDVEALTEKELATLHRYYGELAKLSRTDSDVTESHSVEEARTRHSVKLGSRKTATKGK